MKLAIISDIHEDVVSLKEALYKIEKAGCDEIVCLGDISGFSIPHSHYFDTRNAHECLRIVRENCSAILLGNHDLNAAKSFSKYCPDFEYPENWYSMDYHERKAFSENKLWLYERNELDPLYTHADIEYLQTLSEIYVLQKPDQNILFSHYIFPNMAGLLQGFYYLEHEYKRHFEFMDKFDCRYSFSGHLHPKGLYVATQYEIVEKGFSRQYILDEKANIIVPPVTGKKIGNGFCIFDTDAGWVKALRI